jgi:hypothetical protein
MSCALQTKLNTVPLGQAIVRIVRMIVATVQADVCGLGLSSSATYVAIRMMRDSPADPSTGGKTPAQALRDAGAPSALEGLVSLGGDEFARLVFQAICSSRAGAWTTYATPYSSDPKTLGFTQGACVDYTDARLTALVASLDAMVISLFADAPPEAQAAQMKQQLANTIRMELAGASVATCEQQVGRALEGFAVQAVSGHAALNTIRAEIALALCAGKANDSMSVEAFATHVAGVIVDGA